MEAGFTTGILWSTDADILNTLHRIRNDLDSLEAANI